MNLSFFWSRSFLLNRTFLWLLFIVNFLGTIYGYIWYGGQLELTAVTKPLWMLVFVPDSPTASLFFTLALLYLLFPPTGKSKLVRYGRMFIEGLAVVCSVKYGVWAVAIILAGIYQGGDIYATDMMLIVSHLGMAIEALLYMRFMTVSKSMLAAATCWLLLNDTADYTYGIYPNLPYELKDQVQQVKIFTYCLSLCSLLLALLLHRGKKS